MKLGFKLGISLGSAEGESLFPKLGFMEGKELGISLVGAKLGLKEGEKLGCLLGC